LEIFGISDDDFDRTAHAQSSQNHQAGSRKHPEGKVLHIHPDWLFSRGENPRPYYDVLGAS
jgi:hypothetical protein